MSDQPSPGQIETRGGCLTLTASRALSRRAQLSQPFDNFLSCGIRGACICLAPVAIEIKNFGPFRVKPPRRRRGCTHRTIHAHAAGLSRAVSNSVLVVL